MTKNRNESPKIALFQEVGSAFRIGDPEMTEEFFLQRKRYLRWIPNGQEYVKEAAHWDRLKHDVDEDGLAFIEVPDGTRSVSTVLSGMEAWKGEKTHLLDFVAAYATANYLNYRAVDTGASLDTIAVTPDRQVFVSPPHTLEKGPEALKSWVQKIVQDAQNIVGDESAEQVLVEKFATSLLPLYGAASK